MSDKQYDAALDLLRRLDPRKVSKNLETLCKQDEDLAEQLLASVDQPLVVKECPETNQKFLCCDYNRDGDSYKSPHTGKYYPEVSDAPVISSQLRQLEVLANEAFDTYRELYFEGGLSSVYLWEQEESFAGVVLLKKSVGSSVWDSIHVFEAEDLRSQADYRITSTVMLNIESSAPDSLCLSGHVTKQTQRKLALENYDAHVANVGQLVEEIENQMRGELNHVYFGKTRDIVGDIRSAQAQSEINTERKKHSELVGGLGF